MTQPTKDSTGLSEAELDALEALLVSDSVPEDCMSLEMLDGYLAAVLSAPEPLRPAQWLPSVWSAENVDLSGAGVQRLLSLVLRYHDELVATIGDSDGWQPFCYSSDEESEGARLGDEWMTGFELGLELWPNNWAKALDAHDSATYKGLVERAMGPWTTPDAEFADDDQRLDWLESTAAAVRAIHHLREACDLPPVPPASTTKASAAVRAPVSQGDDADHLD